MRRSISKLYPKFPHLTRMYSLENLSGGLHELLTM